MFQTKLVEKIKTYILCSVTFFLKRAFYEIMGKNIIEPDRPLMTVWCMQIACWITKAANTHSEQACLILNAFPWQQWLHKHASMLRVSFIACLVSTYLLLLLSVFYLFVSVICRF
jgi:hypothetical protein